MRGRDKFCMAGPKKQYFMPILMLALSDKGMQQGVIH
jgi:hypothetical protein